MSSPDEKPPNNPEHQKTIPDKNNLKLKFVALRNGLIEEKNKNKQIIIENENLQKEIEELKKLNTELSTKNTKLDEEKKIKINNIKCTLSLLDKGKAIFVSEDDDIFWLPSSTLTENIKVGNSYLFQIDKLNNQFKKLNEIENIQNKYREWK